MKNTVKRFGLLLLCQLSQAKTLHFEQAIEWATQNDRLNQSLSQQREASRFAQAAVSTWPNPQLSVAVMNASVDGFDRHQHPMTQQQIKYTQNLPKAGANSLKNDLADLEQQWAHWQQKEYQAKLVKQVAQLWLTAHWQQSRHHLLLEQSTLLKQIEEVLTLRYQSGDQSILQAEVLQAQLASQQLTPKISKAKQEQQSALLALNVWFQTDGYTLSDDLPHFTIPEAVEIKKHPTLMLGQIKVERAELQKAITRLGNKTQWGFSAAYGYRQDDAMGQSRDDLISLGVHFDLPWFNRNHVDAAVLRTAKQVDAAEQERQHNLFNMRATWATLKHKAESDEHIHKQYIHHLIPQSQLITENLTQSYANGASQLLDLLKAKKQTNQLQLQAIDQQHQWLLTMTELQYLLAGEQP